MFSRTYCGTQLQSCSCNRSLPTDVNSTTQVSNPAHRTRRNRTAEHSQQEDLPASQEGEYDWPQDQPTESGNEFQASGMTQMSLLQLDEATDPQIQINPMTRDQPAGKETDPSGINELKAMFVSAFTTFNSNFVTLNCNVAALDSRFATLETSNKELKESHKADLKENNKELGDKLETNLKKELREINEKFQHENRPQNRN